MFVAALIFIAALLKPSCAACSKTVSCPCGSTNKNFTFCVDETNLQERPCERWSFCETCREGQNHCASCPLGHTGAFCNTTESLRRIKRFSYRPSQKHPQNQKLLQIGNCPPIRSPENGAIQCTKFMDRGECVGKCIPGYQFDGEEGMTEIKIDCRGGRWTPRKRFPNCKSGDFCKLVSGNSYSSSYNCSIGMDGTKCDITCDGWLRGTFSCFPGREWTPPLPYCIKAKDPPYIAPPLCGCLFGGTCDTNGVCVCPAGRTGQHCEHEDHVRCPDPGTPRGGYRTYLDGSRTRFGQPFDLGNALIFSCPPRHILNGAQVITCMSDGTWSSELPRCVMDPARFCPDLGPVPFAQYSPSATGMYAVGKTLSYQCIQGYSLLGSPTLTCMKNGYWNYKKPTCLRNPTPRTTTTTTADPGFPCTHPGVDKNGEVTDSPLDHRGRSMVVLQPGIRLTYQCNDGYRLIGSDVIICLHTGRWSDSRPKCEKIEVSSPATVTRYCKYPGDVVNGRVIPRVIGEQVQARTQLEIVCKTGFELKGPDTLLCQPNGMWSNTFPTCEAIVTRSLPSCPSPDLDQNSYIVDTLLDSRSIGSAKQESYLAGTFVRVQCKDGYLLVGDDELYCLNTGAWKQAPPICERKPKARILDCENVEHFAHGKIEIIGAQGKRYPPGTQLHYHCNQGYHLKGPDMQVCEPTGYWSAEEPPTCVPDISCPLVSVEHGSMVVTLPSDAPRVRGGRSRYPEGSAVTFSCNVGYVLSGSETLSCLNTGEWSDNVPACLEDCGVGPMTAGTRISFAERTQSGEWPWMVAVSRPTGPLICGGALLDSRTVLSAAHCFTAGSHPYYVFRFGKYNHSDDQDDRMVQVRQSSDIVIHPDFDRETYQHDIALVRLESSVPYNARILPICLPTPETTDENLVPGNKGYLSGWGITEKSKSAASELLMARLTVLSAADCEASFRSENLEVTVGLDRFCAGSTRPQRPNACRGDSGSPLVFFSNDTGRYSVEGIVSASRQDECKKAARYTLFTKVSFYLDWILDNWTGRTG